MASLHIRELDPELLKAVKIAAAQDGKTLKDFVVESLAKVVSEDLKDEDPKHATANRG